MSSDDLNLTVAQSGPELQAAREASGDAPPVPPTLPGYRLEKLLGRGSFGEVWAGVQVRTGLRVAVKVLTRREGLDWLYFKHEVGRLREVSEHPHVVSLLDADLNHDPPYFVMPLLGHGSLHGVARPTFDQALRWIREIALALRFCHEKGLLHCDLKPSNVMLDEEGHVRLVDYGQSRAKGDQTVTYGTLGFMAPEQAMGGETLPSTRWDVYSWGATAYFLLTGQCPRLSEADRTELTRTEDTARRLQQYRDLLHSRPLTPLRTLNPKVDADLAAIVESCLELDPARRTDSIDNVLDDFERRASSEPLLCRLPWSYGYRLRRVVRKPRVALTLFFLVALVASLVWAGITIHRATMAQFQYDGGVVAEQRGDLQQAYLRWAQALEDLPLLMPLKKQTWSVRFNTRLPWVLGLRLGPPVPDDTGSSVTYSPNGKLLVCGYGGGQTLIVNPADGTARPGPALKTAITHAEIDDQGRVLAVSDQELSFDGQTVKGSWTTVVALAEGWAVGSEEGQVLLVPSMGTLQAGSRSPVTCLAFDHGSGRLAVAHQDETVDVGPIEGAFRTVAARGRVKQLVFHQGSLQVERSDASVVRYTDDLKPEVVVGPGDDVESETMGPQGNYLARVYETAVRLRSLEEHRLLPSLHHEDTVKRVVFSPDGKLLATASADRTARIWQVEQGEAASSMLRHASQVYAMDFSPDGKELATLTRLGMLSLWRRAPTSMTLRRLEHPAPVLAMDLEGDHLVTGCVDGSVRLYSLSQPGEPLVVAHEGRVLALAIAPDGQTLATGSTDRKVRFFDLRGNLLGEVPTATPVTALEFSPDGKRVAATVGDTVLLLDPASRQALGQPLPAGDLASELAFSPDGKLLAASGVNTGKVSVWDVATGQSKYRLDHPSIVPSVAFSPDSTWLLTSCNDGRARRWSMADGRELKPSFVEEQPLHAARVSPDNLLVAVSGDERAARVFHIGDDHAGPLLMHHGPVLAMAFNPDGQWVATGSIDSTARVWDSLTGLPLTSSLNHSDGVSDLEFSADGRVLVSMAGSEVCLWNLAANPTSPQRLQLESEVDTGQVLDGHQVRVLTPEEWQKKKAQLGP